MFRCFCRSLWILGACHLLLLVPGIPNSIAETPASNSLMSERTEQTVFDIYAADTLQGTALVKYQGSRCELMDVEETAATLKKLIQPERLIPLLSGPIEKERSLPALGSVRCFPETFRISLDLDPSFFRSKQVSYTDRLTPEKDLEAGLAFRSDFSGSYFGQLQEQFEGAGAHRTSLAWKNYRLEANGRYAEGSDYEALELAAHSLFGRFQYSAGLLQAPQTRFSTPGQFAGLSLQSIDDIVSWNNSLRGSRIELFLNSRSVVRFFRNGTLLATQFLDPGRQEINTSEFPQGSYGIEILITDSNGTEHREHRYFTTSGVLAIDGYPAYSIQSGLLRNQLEVSDHPMFQAQSAYRLLGSLQLEGGLFATDTITQGSLGFLGVYDDNVFYGLGYAQADSGDAGYYGFVNGRLKGFDISLDYNGTSAAVEQTGRTQTPLNPTLPDIPVTSSDFDDLSSLEMRKDSLNILFQKSFGDLDLRFLSRSSVAEDGRRSYSYGPLLVSRLIQDSSINLSFQIGYSFTDRGEQALAGLFFQRRLLPWAQEIQSQYCGQKGKEFYTIRPSLIYQNANRSGRGTSARASTQFSQSNNGGSDLFTSNSLEVREVGNKFEIGGLATRSELSEANTGLGGTLGSSILMGNDGTFTYSSPPQFAASVLVEIAGSATQTKVSLLVDGTEYATVPVGSRTAIGVLPYRRYRVSIRAASPERGELLRVEDRVDEIVVVPGSVVSRKWSVEQVRIVIGKLVDKNGAAIGNERVYGTLDPTITQSNGLFQAEISPNAELWIKSADGRRCIVSRAHEKQNQAISDLGTTSCQNEGE